MKKVCNFEPVSELDIKNETLESILESTADGILVVTDDSKVIRYNNRFVDMFKIPKEILKTKDDRIFIEHAKEQLLNPEEFIHRIKELELKNVDDMDLLYLKGGKIYERYHRPLLIRGKIKGRVWSFRDITKQKEAESKLQKSQALYKKLIEFLPDAVFVHKGDNIIITNQQGVKLSIGEDIHEIIGLPFSEVINIHPKFQGLVKKRLKKLQKEETTVEYLEQQVVLKDGSLKDIEVGATSFLHDNEMYVISLARDISERKKAESLRKQVLEKQKEIDEAKKYDELKTLFFSTLSHELKTPLNVILGTIQLLNTLEISNKSSQYMNRYLNIMMQNCYRLLRIINNLIDITRIDGGFLNLELRNHNIVSLVEEITLSVVEYTKSKNINLIFDTEIEEKIIACDADKIERVLLNLLSNAIKFSNSNGTIEVNIFDKQDYVAISVKDNGIGIPQEMMNKIFERFSQVDSSFTRRTEGSGIGLSLVKSLVELHKGKIEVKSEVNKGSEFIITLPVGIVEGECNNQIATNQPNVERLQIEFSDIYSLRNY